MLIKKETTKTGRLHNGIEGNQVILTIAVLPANYSETFPIIAGR
jgi:hypothetical protein